MSNTTNVVKVPAGLRYERGVCEPVQGEQRRADSPVSSSYRNGGTHARFAKTTRDPMWENHSTPLFGIKNKNKAIVLTSEETRDAVEYDTAPKKTTGIGYVFKALGVILLAPFALFGGGCVFDRSGLKGPANDAHAPDGDVGVADADDAVVPTDGTQDAETDAEKDGETPVDDRPTITWPYLGTLPNNRAFVRWDPPQQIPQGKTLVGYQVSWSDGANNFSKEVTFPFTAVDILTPNATYTVRVRARYNDATYGQNSTQVSVATDSSLLARYRMDEGVGNMINDDSGNGNHGTLVNFNLSTAWTQGIINTGLLFDGVDSYVDTGDTFNFDSTDPFTIEAWVRRASVGSGQMIFSKTDYVDPSNTYRGFWLGYDPNSIKFTLLSDWSADDQLTVASTAQFLIPNQPQNVSLTYDGSSAALGVVMYIDGVAQATTIIDDNLSGTTLNDVPSRIGAAIAVGGPIQESFYEFHGILDNLAIYGAALAQSEISNNTCACEALNRETNSDPTPLPSPLCD